MPSKSSVYSDAALFAAFRQVLRGLDSQSEKIRRKEIKGKRNASKSGQSKKTEKSSEKFTNPRSSAKKSQSSARKTKGGPKDTKGSTQVVAKESPSRLRRNLARAEKFGRKDEADKLTEVISEKKKAKGKKKRTVIPSNDEDFKSGRHFDIKSKKWVPGLRLWSYTNLGLTSILYQYCNEMVMDIPIQPLVEECALFSGSTLREEWTVSSKIRSSKTYSFWSWSVDKSGKPVRIKRDYQKASRGISMNRSSQNWKVYSGICKGVEKKRDVSSQVIRPLGRRQLLRKHNIGPTQKKGRGIRKGKSPEKEVESAAVKSEDNPAKRVTRRRRLVDLISKDNRTVFEVSGSGESLVYICVPKSYLSNELDQFELIENCVPMRDTRGRVTSLAHWSDDSSS